MNKKFFAALIMGAVFFCSINPTMYAEAQVFDDFACDTSFINDEIALDEVPEISESDIRRMARTLYGECRSDDVPTREKAAVVWCILNRLDSPNFPDTIEEVVVYSQFHGYKRKYPVREDLEAIVRDVVARWQLEKQGYVGVGRVLPADYYFFRADRSGYSNVFRKEYKSKELWDWDLPDPYEFGFIGEERSDD